MSRACLICLDEIAGPAPYHPGCLQRLFGVDVAPRVDLDLATLPAAVDEMVGKISISGVQAKLSMKLSADRSRLEVASAGGLYILKPKVFDDLPANEHLSMCLARRAGIDVPEFGLIELADGSAAYVIRRFDRVPGEPPRKRRQEDFCQLTAREPEDKYNLRAEECADVIRRFVPAPEASLRQLFLRTLFSYWIGNGDLHLKNLSLLENENGRFELSPAYDLVSTWLYGDEKLALYVNNTNHDVRRRDWLAFAVHCEIGEADAERMIEELVAQQAAAVSRIDRSLLPPSLAASYKTVLRKRTVALGM